MKLYPGKIDNILVSLQKAGFVINYHVETNTVCDTSNLLQHEERLIYKIQCLCVNTKEITNAFFQHVCKTANAKPIALTDILGFVRAKAFPLAQSQLLT